MEVPDKWNYTCNATLSRQYTDKLALNTDDKKELDGYGTWKKRLAAISMAANVHMLFDEQYATIDELVNALPTKSSSDPTKPTEKYWRAADQAMYAVLVQLVTGQQLKSVILKNNSFIKAWKALCDKNESTHASAAGVVLRNYARFMTQANAIPEDPDNAAAYITDVATRCQQLNITLPPELVTTAMLVRYEQYDAFAATVDTLYSLPKLPTLEYAQASLRSKYERIAQSGQSTAEEPAPIHKAKTTPKHEKCTNCGYIHVGGAQQCYAPGGGAYD